MEIISQKYSVIYDELTNTIFCSGVMRLNGRQEYAPMLQLFDQIVELEPPQITIKLERLEAINSYGISMLGQFIFAIDRKKTIKLFLQGDKGIPWQQKWAKNFQRLMPALQFEWV